MFKSNDHRAVNCTPKPTQTARITAFILVAAFSSVSGQVIYVNDTAGGSDSGTSWGDAYTTLQDALSNALSGDTIWVAAGTYYPDESDGGLTDTDSRGATFQLMSGVVVYGGFAGGEASADERDPLSNPTILSGDITQNDGADFTNYGENAYHVVTASGTAATAVLSGFEIRAGNADNLNPPNSSGGGIYNLAGAATITGNTVIANQATRGGGVYNENANIALAANTITGNNAIASGGGLFNNGGTPTITGSSISGNTADFGAGLYNLVSDVTITGTTISGNTATTETGGLLNDGSDAVVVSTVLHGNMDAGGMDVSAQIGNFTSSTTTISYSIYPSGSSPSTTDAGNNVASDPLLHPLADNGGPTKTMLPGPLSPAVDAGTCSGQTTDQRGEIRPFDSVHNPDVDDACDIGAVELQADEIAHCDAVCYVDASATGAGDGSSWTDAFVKLQDALAVAENGDQIWVADGTYYPDEKLLGGISDSDNRWLSFKLKSNVELYGGFAGGETSLGQRDVSANASILSGDLTQNDGANFANYGENAYRVVTGVGADTTALLDGFTVTGGNADSGVDGGGFYSDDTGRPSIIGNTFVANRTTSKGGGLYVTSTMRIDRNTITGNASDFQGGGILVEGDGDPTISRNTITGNQASSSGGGIFTRTNDAIIVRNLIEGNSAARGGGISIGGGNPTVYANTVTANSTTLSGGGISILGLANASIIGNTVVGNIAGTDGGGIANEGASLTIQSNILYGNTDNSGAGAAAQVYNSPSAVSTSVSYSIVQGGLSVGSVDAGNNLTDDPLLGSLADNGGETETMLPAESSPAVDAGSCTGYGTDQREMTRPFDDPFSVDVDDFCDIGAVELQADEIFAPSCNGICFVDASAVGLEDGSSWTDAFTRLQDALRGAEAGDTIWVANGTYYPDESGGGLVDTDARLSTFQLKNGVVLYGGFAGGETLLEQRDPASNASILSGDVTQNDGPNFANNSENVLQGVNGSGTDATAVLDGFLVTGGNANSSVTNSPYRRGGGIYIDGGGAIISGNTIAANQARQGAGMFAISSNATIVRNTFRDNHAINICGGLIASSGAPTITTNTIVNNSSSGSCGGVGIGFISAVSLIGNTITGNTALETGGGIWNQASTPSIISTIVYGNSDVSGATAGAQITNTNGSTPTVSYSIVQSGLSAGTSDAGNNLTSDPKLGLLAYYGGPTQTLLPSATSPVIDSGSCSGQSIDQRGMTRPHDFDDGQFPDVLDACDIGAVERQAAETMVRRLLAKVFLEGPYASNDLMATGALFQSALPSGQPYSGSEFDETDREFDGAATLDVPVDTVIDWVLVSLRSDSTSGSVIVGSTRAAIVLKDGGIRDVNGDTLVFPELNMDEAYVVIRHRNHMGVISSIPVDFSSGIGEWDFTMSMSQAFSQTGNAMKDLGDGNFGMFAADASLDDQVTASDFNLWLQDTKAVATGYHETDFNLDGLVTASDFNLWLANTKAVATGQVP